MEAKTCNTCCKAAGSPFRTYDGSTGKVVHGCVDEFHTGHLYGESLSWHNRPAAKQIRLHAKQRLRDIFRGAVR